jgi:hypothetical protein
LPYEYVLNTYTASVKADQEYFHNLERPIAIVASMMANQSRDQKKKREPFTASDFYVYASDEVRNIPDAVYSAAARKLIDIGLYPSWALFTYKDLSQRAGECPPPEILAYICDDAMILAPSMNSGVCHGMLIATESASGKIREMRSPCGRILKLTIPKINAKIVALEDVGVPIARN